jgi:N-acetylglutamate synthase-like GNAT family acetyltransferase
MSNNGFLRVERCKSLTEEGRRVLESSYSGQEISQVETQLNDAEYFLVAKIKGEVGVLAIKEKLKERPHLYVVCLAALSGEFWEDTVLRLIQEAKDYAAEKGFRELYIVESRGPYIELLERVGFELSEECHVLAMDIASIPSPRPKSQVAVKRIPGDVRTFVDSWNHIVGSGSPGDFQDFPPITEDYIE